MFIIESGSSIIQELYLVGMVSARTGMERLLLEKANKRVRKSWNTSIIMWILKSSQLSIWHAVVVSFANETLEASLAMNIKMQRSVMQKKEIKK